MRGVAEGWKVPARDKKGKCDGGTFYYYGHGRISGRCWAGLGVR